jgi:hypothetical protein
VARGSLLQIRLEKKRHLPEALVPSPTGGGQSGEELAGVCPPPLVSSCKKAGGEFGVPDHKTPVEHAEEGALVVPGDGDRLLRSPHAVVEPDAAVPDGVPDPIGHLGDVASPLVEQHDVEVASGAQLAATVPADGNERETLAVSLHHPVEHSRHPAVHLSGVARRHRLRRERAGEHVGRKTLAYEAERTWGWLHRP